MLKPRIQVLFKALAGFVYPGVAYSHTFFLKCVVKKSRQLCLTGTECCPNGKPTCIWMLHLLSPQFVTHPHSLPDLNIHFTHSLLQTPCPWITPLINFFIDCFFAVFRCRKTTNVSRYIFNVIITGLKNLWSIRIGTACISTTSSN